MNKEKYILKFFETSLFLSFISGLLYLCGYVNLEAFYSHFNVPVHFINFNMPIVLLYGVPQLIHLIFLTALLLMWSFIYSNVLELLRKIKWSWLQNRFIAAQAVLPATYYYSISLIVLIYLFVFLIASADKSGLDKAKRFAYENAPVACISYQPEHNHSVATKKTLTNVTENCYGMLYADSTRYLLFNIPKTNNEIPLVTIIPVNDIKQFKIVGNIKEFRSNCKTPCK